MDEMQNKAETQPTWLQLTAGAVAGTKLGKKFIFFLLESSTVALGLV